MRTSKTIKQSQEDHDKLLRKMSFEDKFKNLLELREFTYFLNQIKINKLKSVLYAKV